VLRRAGRLRRGGRGNLASCDGADLHRAPDLRLDAVHVLRRPQEGRRRAQAHLHCPTAEIAETELAAFVGSALGRKYPATVQAWERAWERFIPFLAFPPEVRKIIYTTSAIVISSLN
jgi:Transposase, Mutator family